jgi:hypothetical protein
MGKYTSEGDWMDVQVQVAGQIMSKPTSNGGTKFDIPLSNGLRASTFDAALATKVSQFGQQTFTARIEQRPNPRGGSPYTNITAAAGPDETLTPEIPQAGTPIVGAQNLQTGQSLTPAIVPTGIVPQGNTNANGSKKFTEADTIRITKLSALSTATQLVSSLYHGAGPEVLEEAVKAVENLAKHIYTKSRDHEPGAVPQQAAVTEPVVEQSPQAVASFVAENAGSPVVQVGAEGVQPAAEPTTLPWS